MKSLDRLILTRHGESTANVAHVEAWRTHQEQLKVPERDPDVPLTELGRAQAAALGRGLAELPAAERPTVVVCSPFVRAVDTARIALGRDSSLPFRVDERLRDRELGVLDRLTPWGVRARFPEEAERRRRLGKFYHRPPGGESWADVALRLRSVYADIDREHAGERVLVVAHDVVVVLTRYLVEQLSESEVLALEKTPIVNCSLSRWARRGGALHSVGYNDTSHLAGVLPAEPVDTGR